MSDGCSLDFLPRMEYNQLKVSGCQQMFAAITRYTDLPRERGAD